MENDQNNQNNIIRNNIASSNRNEGVQSEILDPDKLDNNTNSIFTSWKNEPTILDLKADLEFSRKSNTDQTLNINGWLDLRNTTGQETGQKTTESGRSQIQPKLIRKHNEWRYPALSEPFLNTDKMFNVNPRTAEDAASARQNELVLNYQIDTKISKVRFIDEYIRTGVDEGTVVLRVGWEKKTEKILVDKIIYDYFSMDPADGEQLQVLAQATELYLAEDPSYEQAPESLKASVEKSLELKEPIFAEEVGTIQVHESVVTKNHPSVSVINVKNFFIDPSCEGKWEEAQFAVITYESTKSNLKKSKDMYKNLDQVNWSSNAIVAKIGDQDHVSNSPDIDSRNLKDKVKALVYEYWGLFDIHNDNILVPIVVTWIGDTIIRMEENPFPDKEHPFILVPYMPILKSSMGEADASLLEDNQRVLGAVNRGMIDLLGRSANAQTGYAKGFLDPVNRRRFNTGKDFEYNPNADPRVAIQQMVYPEIPNSALVMSQMQNAEAEGLSGVKGFSGGITGESYGAVARGITGALDAAGQREISILRRFAEGMRHVGRKFISMNQKFLDEPEVIRITNEEFVSIDKSELQGNFDLKVGISTAKEDEIKSQDLGMMLQTMGPDMDPAMSGMILSKIAELKRMPALAEEIRNYRPKPDPIQEELGKLQIEQAKAELAKTEAQTAKLLAEAENTALDTEMDQSGTSHERDVEKQGAQARGNRDLEVTKSLLAGESPSGNIEAAVGFNKLTESSDQRDTALATPTLSEELEPPLVPLQNQPQQGELPIQPDQELPDPRQEEFTFDQ